MIERHFTVTVYVLQRGRALLLPHPKFGNKWLPPGGHLEPNELPPDGARREVFEETGLEVEFVAQENIGIDRSNAVSFLRPYLCLLESVPPHNGLPAHQHMDLIYLAHPKDAAPSAKADCRWFSLEEVEQMAPDEEIFVETQQTLRHLLLGC